ncbi:hypothetical protein BDC45DRAFT_536861 [Circinella umbellata]|nr:hypothetical protein BDC45DRAFT_536861 [Circinella umbellata]
MDPNKYYNALKTFYLEPEYTVLLVSQKSYPDFELYINQIIFTNPWWDLAFDNDIITRMDHIGRAKPIKTHYISANETRENHMLDLKKHVKSKTSERLDLDDILYIFRG